ncbi:SAM-dependent methyltransferase [Nonomuraea pusilla]|uniref:O-Methyltransferase involved in polyketide biosynthesis n=1 Tax=Nonomuraea pusilla TaxID=46177 RepID=A0A1H7KLP2_9ACTN|nr:SAM-dependent methyltransferase [Nonomuraea pusilla]SEK87702.1 O-Methyltransferase involved in polyketide biosynthesis [Nonomuraea pusilla]
MRPFDPRKPNLARMYDYMLGGSANYAVDRQAIEQLAELIPQAVPLARANRAFMQRAVRYLGAAGVRQFLDLGSGLPTQGSVHEVAPEARVVYVDNDPEVAAHARSLLAGTDLVAFVEADLLDPDAVLGRAAAHLDLDEPVAVLLISMLHFVPDSAGPQGMVASLRAALAPGGFLVLTHSTSMGHGGARTLRRGSSAGGGADRSVAEIRAFFGDFALEPPGLVQAADWRPDRPKLVVDRSLPSYLMAGVGRKG